MNQDNTSDTEENKKSKKLSKLPLEVAIILAIIILLTLVAIIGHRRSSDNTSNKKVTVVPAAYADEPLVPFTLKGLSLGQPEELLQYSKSDTQAEFFNHYISRKDQKIREIYSSVAYVRFTAMPSNNDLIALNANLQNPKYKDYAKTVDPIRKFVSDRLPADSKLTLKNGAQFKNESIKANAWSFDLEAANSKVKSNPIKGKVIYFVDGQDQYYFMLYTSSRDWPVNQSEWTKVFNSLKYSV